ncbi:thiamine pyrophosphokinase [Irpex rosettiformis]|uniref:Thiamine pyrophosphokinase n=1 Tax=Irpex rosettiformis TaxID=378272 RepID=A0ACB8U7C4_9APHY|nr:thiamine pyrophosphokinase [Irpex rosettiformis]
MPPLTWDLSFLEAQPKTKRNYALIILNQPFSFRLLQRLWQNSSWHCCADGGANRLLDTVSKAEDAQRRLAFLPDLIKGDLDSLRDDVRDSYASQGVAVIHDHDQYSTDLMKCVEELVQKEHKEGIQYDIIILGGLSGRLDQTIHTLSYLHKLRKVRERVFTVTDDNVAWVLDEGEHHINIDQKFLGQTCGLLPVGVDKAVLTTQGLKWNLSMCLILTHDAAIHSFDFFEADTDSCFDGMVSTSNHLLPEEPIVYVKTSKPIVWTAELKVDNL